MKATPASDIRQITLDDMLTMKLVTSADTVELLTAQACASAISGTALPGIAAKPTGGTNARGQAGRDGRGQGKDRPPTLAGRRSKTRKPFQGAQESTLKTCAFVVVRGSRFVGIPMPGTISAEGAFDAAKIFGAETAAVARYLGNRRLPVVISSTGGDVFSALAAGRLIHERKLDVAVGRTDFVGCDPAEWSCLAEDGAYVGLSTDAGVECDFGLCAHACRRRQAACRSPGAA